LRKIAVAAQGVLFAAAFLLGMMPTLLANAINAGSPFSTTYGAADAAPLDFTFRIIWHYLADMQFILLLLAGAWTVIMWRSNRADSMRQVAFVTAGNLFVNSAFFLTHPVFTPYYTVPVAMLSLWSLLFASLNESAEVVDGRLVGQAAGA
jgi:hypothetical protein